MRTRKAIRATAVGLFILIIWSPTLQKQLNLFRYTPLIENRLKMPCPADWQTMFRTDSTFGTRFEEFFNDHFGLRDLLIQIKNQIDYALFRKSEKIVIGRDGWLFYKSYVEGEEVDLERATPQEWQTMFGRLLKLNRLLASRGITLVILPCPMKNSIYPEQLPPSAPRRPHPTAFDTYRRFLSEHPEIVTVDPTSLLLKLKPTLQVYHKTDFHWTDPAGAQVVRELVDRLATMSGMGRVWDQPIEATYERTTRGGENTSLGLLWPSTENTLMLRADLIKPPVGKYSYTKEANEWTYQTGLADASKLIPTTVMFGDSFADAFLRAGFTAYFARFQKFYNWDFSKKYPGIPEGTRFVVLQHIEVFLQGMLSQGLWPDEILTR